MAFDDVNRLDDIESLPRKAARSHDHQPLHGWLYAIQAYGLLAWQGMPTGATSGSRAWPRPAVGPSIIRSQGSAARARVEAARRGVGIGHGDVTTAPLRGGDRQCLIR